MNKTFPSFLLNLGQKTSQGSEFYSFLLANGENFSRKRNPWNKLEMCLKTDKGNAKLNSWCERKGTMKASRWDTFLEKISISLFLFLLACFIFFTDMLYYRRLKALYYFLFSFSFSLCGIHPFFYLPSGNLLGGSHFSSFVSDT